MIGKCKDCKFWGRYWSGVCDKEGGDFSTMPKSSFSVEAFALDDSGLTASLRTGPEFGCVHFLSKRRNS